MSTTNQGEHTFADGLLISGEEIRGYTASEDLTRGEPVTLSGDKQVGSASAGGPFYAIALYDVSNGEEVALAGPGCEVKLEIAASISANDALTPDGSGAFVQADETNNNELGVALAAEGGSSGDWIEALLYKATGVTA